MHVQEDAGLEECAHCGATLDPEVDRACTIGDEVLCFSCAVREGGVYDEARAQWIVPPAISRVPSGRTLYP